MSVSTALILCAHVARSESPAKIDYNLHIRPILAENCFKCHGADEKQRKGKLRLDVREEALAKKAIIPGKPDESEAIKRLITTDEDDMMPPPKEHRKINDADRALLSRWITEGADYKKHWAFIPPVKSPVPEIQNSKFKIQNPIDAFILTKLDDLKLNPAPPASKEQWLR
ncbi:MAG: c-type cytochrome domain-containing protein, partial [Verrucomicrobiaceae bacterium]